MVKRLFVDLESTGDGSNMYHDFVELNAKYYENERLISTYTAHYGYNPSNVYHLEINKEKAIQNSKAGHGTTDEDIDTFVMWLEMVLDGSKCFFIAYNCEWDYRIIKNWFKRNGISKKYFYDPCLCVMSLCACRFDQFMSLTKCADKLGVQVDSSKKHTAEYDNQLSIKLFGKLNTKLKAA